MKKPCRVAGAAMVIERSKNPEAFIGFERSGWDANIAGYKSSIRVRR